MKHEADTHKNTLKVLFMNPLQYYMSWTLICPTNIHDSNVNKRLQHQWINEVTLANEHEREMEKYEKEMEKHEKEMERKRLEFEIMQFEENSRTSPHMSWTLICPTNIHDSNVNKRLQHQWIYEVTLASSPFISPRLSSSTSIVLRHVFHHPHQH